jgi:hypothetical protein
VKGEKEERGARVLERNKKNTNAFPSFVYNPFFPLPSSLKFAVSKKKPSLSPGLWVAARAIKEDGIKV